MSSDVRAVPIGDMGDEDGCGGLTAQDVSDASHHGGPDGRFFRAALGGDLFEAVRAGLDQSETHVSAGGLEFGPAFRLTGAVAALGDGDILYAPSAFPEEAKSEAADDAFVVGVRGKDESLGRARTGCGHGGRS